ncbi:DNA-3-methyladenine glycosylase [Bacillus sp. V3-13]|uniref:DNA-3-methyladenine glycosylase family protein n=1 Tax=Bacillus sp. V3-13 TaxID=2053728 RepID=UPI000C79209D|nr:DNA-3-methyladenine glycosylase [Bacillus sp. V3-13]
METLKIAGPYNFDLVLDRLSLDSLNTVNKEKRAVKVPLVIEREPFVAEITAKGTVDEPEFSISGIENRYKEPAIARLSAIFQWHTPLQQIHQHFQATKLKDLFTKHYGTPLVLDFDPYSCLLKCIVHQQLNLSFAQTLTERMVKTFGFEKDGVWFYPQPERLAALKTEDLRALQFSGRKAEYVIGIAREIVEGRLDFSEIEKLPDDEIMAKLIKLRGVGPWTVQNFLLFGLGRPNHFPTADIGIQNALKILFGLDRKPTLEEMEDYKIGWEPYLSYASLYLWRSIE